MYLLYKYRITFIDLPVLNHPCIPGMKPGIMVCDLFNVLLNLVCRNFIEDFYICVYQGNWSVVFVLLLWPYLVLVLG
jgi:hypothetical protein